MTKTQKTRIADLPDGTVVRYDDGANNIDRGIICRPPHLTEAAVYTPGGYAGLTGDDRVWSIVDDSSEVYRSEAVEAELKFRQKFASTAAPSTAAARIKARDADRFTPNPHGFKTPYFSYRVSYNLHRYQDNSDTPRKGSRAIVARSEEDARDEMIVRRDLENSVTEAARTVSHRRRSYIGMIDNLIERA